MTDGNILRADEKKIFNVDPWRQSLFCYSLPQNQNKTFKQSSFKQKSFDDFTVAQSLGQQFASLFASVNCCTSTQTTCTWLVQIASRDVNKYALLTSQHRATLKSSQFFGLNDFCWNFFLVLRYNKTNSDWRVDHHWKLLTLNLRSWATFYEHLGQKMSMMTSMPVTIFMLLPVLWRDLDQSRAGILRWGITIT